MVVGGKGTNKKTTLYVGGLEENVNEAILHSAFIPFGDIKDVNIPLDNTTGKHRGFGFVEYENAEVSASLRFNCCSSVMQPFFPTLGQRICWSNESVCWTGLC